jgi:hypothetical protein
MLIPSMGSSRQEQMRPGRGYCGQAYELLKIEGSHRDQIVAALMVRHLRRLPQFPVPRIEVLLSYVLTYVYPCAS